MRLRSKFKASPSPRNPYLVGLLVGVACFCAVLPAGAAESQSELLSDFKDIYDRIRALYVEPVDGSKLSVAAVNGMLNGLDADAAYLEPGSQHKAGEMPGLVAPLGLVITIQESFIQVVAPLDDGPSTALGIHPRDRIVALDGQTLFGLSLYEAVERLATAVPAKTGDNAGKLKLTVQRGTTKLITFDVTPVPAPKPLHVTSRVQDEVGVIRIPEFTDHTAAETAAVLEAFRKSNAGLKGYVLDLRNDPGGSSEQAIKVAELFVRSGVVAVIHGRTPSDSKEYKATPAGAIAATLPLVALVNGGTAEGGEVIAAALQDRHRGVVMGTTTYGRTGIQKSIPLPNGGTLRLTTARFVTPGGKAITGDGITPDIVVPQAQLDIKQPLFMTTESSLRGALSNPTLPKPGAAPAKPDAAKPDAAKPDAAKSEAAKPEAEAAKPDYQISRAVDLVHGIALYQVSAQKTD